MTITLPSTHPLFSDAELDFGKLGIATVEIHFGINDAFTSQLEGSGNVPCWCTVRDSAGGLPGMANIPGFVVRLDHDQLVEAGADNDDLWIVRGAARAELIDPHDAEHRPICIDCLSHGDTYRLAGDEDDNSPIAEEYNGTEACWCCCEMISASDEQRAADERTSETEIMTSAQDFIDTIDSPCLFFTSVGCPGGQSSAVCKDYTFPFVFSELEGTVSHDGNRWEWNGDGAITDDRNTDIGMIVLNNDRKCYVKDLCKYATSDGCRDRTEIIDYLDEFDVTEEEIDSELSDWFTAEVANLVAAMFGLTNHERD